MCNSHYVELFFFFNDTATTEIYTLSLHDALPIWCDRRDERGARLARHPCRAALRPPGAALHVHADLRRRADVLQRDRKSTRLNSSHANISYAVFCLKKKNRKCILVEFYTRDILPH